MENLFPLFLLDELQDKDDKSFHPLSHAKFKSNRNDNGRNSKMDDRGNALSLWN